MDGKPSQSAPLADFDAVRTAATTLMLVNGCTTTLDVKNLLRQKGYVAYQRDVSRLMQQIALREGWPTRDTGDFLVYGLR